MCQPLDFQNGASSKIDDVLNLNDHDMEKRGSEFFKVKRGLTERLRRSAIPHMQRLLNDHQKKRRDICRKITSYKPVNNGSFVNLYH